MLARFNAVRLLPRMRQAMLKRNSHDHHHHEIPALYRQPIMDEFPVPRGSWQAKHDEVQKSNNIMLITSVLAFSISAWYWYQVTDFVTTPPLDSIKRLD